MKKQKRPQCATCKYADKLPDALICNRYPPTVAVIDNKPMTMRVSVNAKDQACGEYRGKV